MPPTPPKNPGHAPAVDPQGLKDIWRYNLTNHKPTQEAIKKIEGFRSAAIAMADCIVDLTPAGRDQALALTHLEEMSFHGIAAIVRADNEDINKTPEEDKHLDQKEKN